MNRMEEESYYLKEFKLFFLEEFKFIENEYEEVCYKVNEAVKECHEECPNSCLEDCGKEISIELQNNLACAQENISWAFGELENQISCLNKREKELAIQFLKENEMDIEGLDIE